MMKKESLVMAFFEMSYYSDALRREVIVNVILPEKRRNEEGAGAPENPAYKTLYLFHGLSGNRQDWIQKTSIRQNDGWKYVHSTKPFDKL